MKIVVGDNTNAEIHSPNQQREEKEKSGWKKIENFALKMKHHLAKDMNILKGDKRKSNVIFGDNTKTADGIILCSMHPSAIFYNLVFKFLV